jgi:stage IV sporulation protein FB
MKVPEPGHTRFDLRWRLGGVPVRINPLFWLAAALLGLKYYLDPEAGGPGYFLFWMAAALLSVLAHQFGQVLAGRLFGLRGEVVLFGLGGRTLGIDDLPRRRQRVLVLLAGPLVNGLIVAAVLGLTYTPFPTVFLDWGWAPAIATGAAILVRINLYWALLNLVPLWPLDGGRSACAIGEGLLGRRGLGAALGLSLILAGGLGVWVTLEMSREISRHEQSPFDQRYVLHLTEFTILLLFCFLLWMLSFRALWPAEPDNKEPTP